VIFALKGLPKHSQAHFVELANAAVAEVSRMQDVDNIGPQGPRLEELGVTRTAKPLLDPLIDDAELGGPNTRLNLEILLVEEADDVPEIVRAEVVDVMRVEVVIEIHPIPRLLDLTHKKGKLLANMQGLLVDLQAKPLPDGPTHSHDLTLGILAIESRKHGPRIARHVEVEGGLRVDHGVARIVDDVNILEAVGPSAWRLDMREAEVLRQGLVRSNDLPDGP